MARPVIVPRRYVRHEFIAGREIPKREHKRKTPGAGPGVLTSVVDWLRGTDSNRRPSGYEPDELPLLHLAHGLYTRLQRGWPSAPLPGVSRHALPRAYTAPRSRHTSRSPSFSPSHRPGGPARPFPRRWAEPRGQQDMNKNSTRMTAIVGTTMALVIAGTAAVSAAGPRDDRGRATPAMRQGRHRSPAERGSQMMPGARGHGRPARPRAPTSSAARPPSRRPTA